jgi:Uma2 family endonuclease
MMETALHPPASPKQFARPSAVPMSYEEYLALPDEVHTAGLVEWAHNEAIFHMPPNINHQDLTTFLSTLLRFYVDLFKLGRLFASPVEVKLPSGQAREPDVVFVANENLGQVTPQRIAGAPNLIVEIVSPESAGRDFDTKFDEYQDAGVQEYWLIDPRPRRKQALFYRLNPDGLFKLANLDDGIYRSSVLPKFWLRTDWLWQTPQALLALSEIIGTDILIDKLNQNRNPRNL